MTTTFVMDLNSGLTQALSDGTHDYIYGNGRIAQVDMATQATEYFLGDALSSVRQLTDSTGAVTFAQGYTPYGTVSSTAGSASAYGFTNEYQSQGKIYLRARHYLPSLGRFLTRDTWEGNNTRPLSYNRWNYVEGNPVNRVDPSGKFPKEMIEKNISIYEFFDYKNHTRAGFYALLLLAENDDYVRSGSIDLTRLYPKISYNSPKKIWSPDCKTIFIGNELLRLYYYREVTRQRNPSIWWRDTSARHHELSKWRNKPYGMYTFVDGGLTQLPNYRSINLGAFVAGFDLVSDQAGRIYLSGSAGQGRSIGVSYTESYSCTYGIDCSSGITGGNIETLTNLKEVAVNFCLSVGAQVIGGISGNPLCLSLNSQELSLTTARTFSKGIQAGFTLDAVFSFPVSQGSPRLGWQKEIEEEMNGITMLDILTVTR